MKPKKLLSFICIALLVCLAVWHLAGNRQEPMPENQTPAASVAIIEEDGIQLTAGTGQDSGQLPSDDRPQLAVLDAGDVADESPASNNAADPQEAAATPKPAGPPQGSRTIVEDGLYTSKDDVALYIHSYGHLSANFITKAQARELGWGDTYSSVDDAAPGKSIGGDRFGNREGLLPKKKGRTYTECDIETMGKKSRGAKRIVFSNDGLIYYTGDHYESFELLYGSE